MKPDPAIIELLVCPRCKGKLEALICSTCDIQFPQVSGIPVMLNERNSLFKFDDFTLGHETTYKNSSNMKKRLKSIIPSISLNVKAKANFQTFFTRLVKESAEPMVLVVGGAVAGEGLENFPAEITLVETDVALGPRTALICDVHDLPFPDESFDGAVAQAVLEHVLDPAACVSEIHRVLKKGGIIYAETPFMQQVHAGRYDFTRFTHLGHRYLFRRFAEIDGGPSCGPGMALVWAYCYFLQSFFGNKTWGQAAFAFGSFTGFWLKYLDYFLVKRPNAYDAASGYFFIGQKADAELSGNELIKGYKGMIY